MPKRYTSRNDAVARGGKDVWPCGELGKCRPCGSIANLYVSSCGGAYTDQRWMCVQNHRRGCPTPIPEPSHDYGARGACLRCGQHIGWQSPDGRWWPTLEEAKLCGRWKREDLTRGQQKGHQRTKGVRAVRKRDTVAQGEQKTVGYK